MLIIVVVISLYFGCGLVINVWVIKSFSWLCILVCEWLVGVIVICWLIIGFSLVGVFKDSFFNIVCFCIVRLNIFLLRKLEILLVELELLYLNFLIWFFRFEKFCIWVLWVNIFIFWYMFCRWGIFIFFFMLLFLIVIVLFVLNWLWVGLIVW